MKKEMLRIKMRTGKKRGDKGRELVKKQDEVQKKKMLTRKEEMARKRRGQVKNLEKDRERNTQYRTVG